MLVWLLKTVLKLVRHSLVLSSLFYLSLFIAILIYHLFYQWYMPRAKIEKSIDFELKTSLVYPRQHHQHLSNRMMSHELAALSTSPQYYQSVELVAHVNLFDRQGETFHYGQEYSIGLVMDVPESDWNFDIGMFGITVDVIDVESRKIVTYKTMGTLVYKSTLLRFLTTLFYFPWYLLGRFEQKQTISLMIKDNFIDNAYMPANRIVIRLSDKLQYYTAILSIEAKLTGLKYYLNRWYYTCSIIICLALTFVTFLILLSSCFDFKSILYRSSKKDQKRKSLQNNNLVPYKKLAYPYEFDFDKPDNGDIETSSMISSSTIGASLDETATSIDDNESTSSTRPKQIKDRHDDDADHGDGTHSLQRGYSLLSSLRKRTFMNWSYF